MRFAFIDLHIHSEFSDEVGCNLKIEDLLDSLQATAEDAKGNICFSITDHDSALGSIKAKELIEKHPKIYNNLVFIPGIELTVGIEENKYSTITNKKIEKISSCHMLGYNYDINDKNIIAYSKLKHFNNDLRQKKNTGNQILAGIHQLRKFTKLPLPYSLFEDVTNQATHGDAVEKFLQIATENTHLDKTELRNILSYYINFNIKGFKARAEEYVKLDIFDAIDMIKNAGGQIGFAHPSSIKINDTKSSGNLIILYNLLKLNGKNIDFIELFCHSCESSFEKYYEFAKNNNLFITAGSDHHGPFLHSYHTLGKCFPKRVEFVSTPKDKLNENIYEAKNNIVNLAFVDICFNIPIKDKLDFVFQNKYTGYKTYQEILQMINDVGNIDKEAFLKYYSLIEDDRDKILQNIANQSAKKNENQFSSPEIIKSDEKHKNKKHKKDKHKKNRHKKYKTKKRLRSKKIVETYGNVNIQQLCNDFELNAWQHDLYMIL